jgi:hypothetical protein
MGLKLSGDRVPNPKLKSAFPLFQGEAYDFCFHNSPWKIGLQSTYPNHLKKKIAAVLVSEQLQLKSVDHAMRQYVSTMEYPEGDPSRLDWRVVEFINKRIATLSAQIYSLSLNEYIEQNKAIGLLTLQRAQFSMEFLIFCGHRGALFEAMAIARMMLEQVAWASSLVKSNNEDAVYSISSTHAIHELKKSVSFVGKLYGWFSTHVHWEHSAHKKVVISMGGKVGHQFASSYFKAIIMCMTIVLLQIYFEGLWTMMRKELEELQREPGACFSTPDLVRQEANVLLAEIRDCEPSDNELSALASMLSD